MLAEKYDFRITDQMTIPLRPHWIANDSYREKCKMLVLNRSKGEIHKVDFSKVTDYIKEGDVICFNDSTIINHMFICKTRQNRLIKIVLEGFLPNNRVIISGLLKERLNANDVFYLVDNPGISIKVEQKFSEESQYRAVVENHEALICYLASHGERLDEYVWTPACFINIQMLTVPFFLKSMVLWKYLLPAFILPGILSKESKIKVG